MIRLSPITNHKSQFIKGVALSDLFARRRKDDDADDTGAFADRIVEIDG